MFLKKLSKEERHKLRQQRKESQLIRQRAKERRFLYVVNPPEIPRVVFGTSLEREILPLQGPCVTSFMRQHQGDISLSPGPAARVDERDHLKINYASRLGYSAFASKMLRLPPVQTTNYPCVGTYDVDVRKSHKKSFKPFNVGEKRVDKQQFLTPGPSTYPFHVSRRQPHITTAFGSQRKTTPVVTIFCSPFNIAKCQKCNQALNGDYWHDFNNNLDLCRPCMHKIERILKSCTATEIQRLRLRRKYEHYKPVRYCGFYHDHNGTTAAIPQISLKTLKFKINKENYLSLFM